VDTLAATTQPAAGIGGPKPGGVVSTGANAGTNLAGAKQQPSALTSEAQVRALTDKELDDKLIDQMMFGGDDTEFKLLKANYLK
jgi:hypothetical protein